MTTYQIDNKEAGALVKMIKWSVSAWFYGNLMMVWKYRQEMVKKLLESFNCNAALLVHFSMFDPITLIVQTTSGAW